MACFRSTINYIKNKLLLHNSCRDLISFINILPTVGGFSFHNEKIVATFWILHTALLFYVYVYATVVYQMYYASKFVESVNSFLNISIFILIVNSSVWLLSKRSHLKIILKLITKNDDLLKETSGYLDKQCVFLRQIKYILIIYYMFHFINDICIFIPTRIINLTDGTIGTCFGLEPMDETPNREICEVILTFQELTSMVAVASYDVTLIFLLAHTTAMYNVLYEDVLSLNDIDNIRPNDDKEVSERLKNYIVRHSFLLQTVHKLQEIYSSAIGVGFGVNAMSLSLFLFLPLELWLEFAPIVYYSLCVFFLYCFQGQRLTSATERLEMAVYCCGWEKFGLPFWVFHVIIFVYVYVVGSVVFQINCGRGARDFVKSYLNISLVVMTLNNSYWIIMKRSLLRIVLTMVSRNDDMSRASVTLWNKHEKYMAVVKKIVFVFYALNLVDAYCIYLPHLIDLTNNHYSMTLCVGLEPLTAFPNRQVCLAILITQHVAMVSVVLSYQAILLFLIVHTTAMYHLLSADMMLLKNIEDLRNADNIVKEKLRVLIRRHGAILETINRIKALYSMPLGVNFGANALCILIFFYIPLQEWVQYSPVLVYCFLVFFLYCFLCQRLINAGELFERAVYSCGWENFEVKEQKLVYVMLMQAQKPILLLAADIIPVNIYTFATTLQAMYKFVTVVNS